jgi:hypothetical protein
MFDSLFLTFRTSLWIAVLIAFLVSLVFGFLSSLVYQHAKKNEEAPEGMSLSIVLLPALASLIVGIANIYLQSVEVSVGCGIAIAGIFALTRFRSEPMKMFDLTIMVACSAVGVGSGFGYVAYAGIGGLFILGVILILSHFHFGETNPRKMEIRITIPEDLNYEHCFDSVFEKYCEKVYLEKTKTVDFGQLFELKYSIVFKKEAFSKEFLDELRVLNGNLQIILTSK